MALHGTVWPADGAVEEVFDFDNVDFISFVAFDTFGKPAIIAPGTDNFTAARDRDSVTVLYVNPGNIAAMKATKIA